MRVVFILCALALGCAHAQDLLFPHGANAGDAAMPLVDDSYSSSIPLSSSFWFFGTEQTNLFVCTNGIISFGSGISSFTPTPFPVANSPVISPFWGDVDTRNGGNIYYREVTEQVLLDTLTATIVDHFGPRNQVNAGFQASFAFIVTWVDAAAYGGGASPANTFQAVLVTDGTNSFVIYNYEDIIWTYGSASSGVDAQVGFDAGDGVNFFALPSSRTPDIANVDDQTNVDMVGRWMFRVDLAEIVDGGAQPTCNTEEGVCDPHQAEDEEGNCQNVAPAIFGCSPLLSDPIITSTVTNGFKFNCEVTFTLAENTPLANHVFEVEFVFNRRSSSTPITQTFTGSDLNVAGMVGRVSIDQGQLVGSEHLGKWLSCSVVTYFVDTPEVRSEVMYSNGYWIGVKAMEAVRDASGAITEYVQLDYIELDEADDEPTEVYLMSTLPIQGLFGRFHHYFPIYHSTALMVKQQRGYQCSYDFYGQDWDDTEENVVHNEDFPLQVRTVTTITTEPLMIEHIYFRANPNEPFRYWAGYAPASITVYRYNNDVDDDSDVALPDYCFATGDPRMLTFDDT